MSRGFGGGEILILSQKQIDEGFESIDDKPRGTGPYEYGGRKVGQSIWFERIEGDHWRGERPDFKEIEIRWMREEASRLAAILVGEIHIASLSRGGPSFGTDGNQPPSPRWRLYWRASGFLPHAPPYGY
ncbi:MAG: hypothetical protein IID18_01035 [Nitrospinae bacterium]|nr:hypothetical protein [Nitrospinota bacterium]